MNRILQILNYVLIALTIVMLAPIMLMYEICNKVIALGMFCIKELYKLTESKEDKNI